MRQLWDWKASADLSTMSEWGLHAYTRACGWSLARAHARSGDRLAIAAYLGAGSSFDQAIAGFSRAYADQNERDHQRLADAVAAGEVVASLRGLSGGPRRRDRTRRGEGRRRNRGPDVEGNRSSQPPTACRPEEPMTRTRLLTAAATVALAAGSASAGTVQAAPPARAAAVAKVQLRHTGKGTILVNGSGFTLYRFTKDSHDANTCVTVRECPANWPALRSSGRPIAGHGVKASLLSTIRLPNGARQVTYAGRPLYMYAAASEPAETVYVGAMQFGGTWDAVSASGNLVK